ncbi:hypothetical protein [Variovorax fucosicus]|uniref:hypothetical protein n=1 Tax=Variovorax fucosicus TaxID=3053517 RepID=UPI00257606BC|nr:hypothetical protein [Variovorax sp. J22G47]MDM0057342.1 hypothetical protein [Variovorax sp. J22G47]
MYEDVRESLERAIYRPETDDWDLRYFDGTPEPVTNTKMRGMVRRMLERAPGPFLMHTQLRSEARAILRYLRERSRG